MTLEPRYTADGSVTLLNTVLNATYHSRFGALQESRHIYIDCGLKSAAATFGTSLSVFEMGFGTGLNAWLTQQEAKRSGLVIDYRAVEKYPVPHELFGSLNYSTNRSEADDLMHILSAPWEKAVPTHPYFSITKIRTDITGFDFPGGLHVVYYDAFDPATSPDCWSPGIFQCVYAAMCQQACLVTFCARGQIKRLLRETGFFVETLTGPPGKREITRAIKT